MFWGSLPTEERLRLWKKLRTDINLLPKEERLNEVAKFCSTIPFGSRSIDYYTPENWPTPWEILSHDLFCTSSISLLIFYTLTMLDDPESVELHLVNDTDGQYLLPIIDNKFILNYEIGKVSTYSELNDDFTVLQRFSKEKIKQIN